MESRHVRANRSTGFALLASLILHVLVLWLGPSEPPYAKGSSSPARVSRLDATLASPAAKPSKPQAQARKTPTPRTRAKVLTAPGPGPRTWSLREKDEMDRFLKELKPTPAASGKELAQRGLAMARDLGRQGSDDAGGEAPGVSTGGKGVDGLSLELYFDAFVRKLNRSAAFVKRENRGNGRRKALVQIILNADGSLQSYKVLRAADQELEIAYIRSVVERAAPFAAFPPDIKNATKSLTVNMCITPQGSGDGFVRMGGSEACRD